MKNNQKLIVLFVIAAVTLIIFASTTELLAKKEIVLKTIGTLPKPSRSNDALWKVMEIVNQKAKGELVIEFLGGPEVIGAFDQGKAVQSGVVDMSFAFAGAYGGLVDGVGSFSISRITVADERSDGFVDLIQNNYRKKGLFYLGRGEFVDGVTTGLFAFFLNTRVEKLEDLAGLKLAGTSPLAIPFIKALGASPVVISFGNLYTAMDTGVIDGFRLPISSVVPIGLHKVSRYYLNHTFFKSNMTFIINLKIWERIPKHLQDIIQAAVIKAEQEMTTIYSKNTAKDLKTAQDAGLEVISFSSEDAEKFTNIAYDAEWKSLIKKFPELGPKLKKLVVK